MDIRNIKFTGAFYSVLFILWSAEASALCVAVTGGSNIPPQEVLDQGYFHSRTWTPIERQKGVPVFFGTVTVGSGMTSTVPVGGLIAKATGYFKINSRLEGYTANQIIMKCDKADYDAGLKEMFIINQGIGTLAAQNYTGKLAANDVPDAYLTRAKGVAFRILHNDSGQYYSHTWKSAPLKLNDSSQYVFDAAKKSVYITASAFSDVTIELVKTNDQPSGKGILGPKDQDYSEAFKGANKYIQGISTINRLSGGEPREGSSTFGLGSHYFLAGWSFMGSKTVVNSGATCVFESVNPSRVKFPASTSSDIIAGNVKSDDDFTVTIKCDDDAISGTGTGHVAMGFKVDQPTAFSAAQSLNLINTEGGVSHLLDSFYGSPGVASNVGIAIRSNKLLPGSNMRLLSPTSHGLPGTGNSAGWYAFAELLNHAGSILGGGQSYSGSFSAYLQQLDPADPITSGTINAQAQIVVNLQ